MSGIPTAQTSPLAASGQAEINETAGAKFHTAMELFWTRRAYLTLLIVIYSSHRLVWIFLAYLAFLFVIEIPHGLILDPPTYFSLFIIISKAHRLILNPSSASCFLLHDRNTTSIDAASAEHILIEASSRLIECT
jgi:hypothetical protein